MSNTQPDDNIKNTQVLVRTGTSSSSLSGTTVQTPRTARFAEATSVNSPIDPSGAGRNPFSDPPTTRHLMPQAQPSDVGFGYMADNQASKHNSYAGVEMPVTPNSPLKSALKPPGTPGRLNPLSPTFREEQILEEKEDHTEKQNAKDLVRNSPSHNIADNADQLPENQNSGSHGQNVPQRDKFQLQPYRPCHAFHNLYHLQFYQGPSPEKRHYTLGTRSKDMAADPNAQYRLCISGFFSWNILRLLERRS